MGASGWAGCRPAVQEHACGPKALALCVVSAGEGLKPCRVECA